MRFSLDWLRDFVEIDLPAETLAARLTTAGLAVDAVMPFEPPCDPGGEPDAVLEIDITGNRVDAMNHYGLAREIAAILERPLRPPDVVLKEDPSPASGAARVAIEAADLCPRYVGRVVRGLTIMASPLRMRRRLEAAGLVPRNNVVDASNYVLFELGQPLHTFDLARLEGNGVVVRRARAGEKIVTVADRLEKVMADGMLLIAEAGGSRRPCAIAGVMGGFDSAISDATRDVLIESAWFDPLSVRRTARALDLRTDASHRFERGADPGMTRFAADRLAALLASIAGGGVLAGAIDVRAERRGKSARPGGTAADESTPWARPLFEPPWGDADPGGRVTMPLIHREEPIVLRLPRLTALLGSEAGAADVPQKLERIGVVVQDIARVAAAGARETVGGRAWMCRAPSWRWDLGREVDLVEEYARLAGYDAIPETLPAAPPPPPRPDASTAEDSARDLLASFGCCETINYSMIPAADDELFGSWRPPGDPWRGGPFTIVNPLSDRWVVMRRSMLPGLARALAFNVARGRFDLRLFEVGTTHAKRGSGEPIEERVAAIGAAGLAAEPAWPTPPRPFDVLDLKGAVEDLARRLTGGRACVTCRPVDLGSPDASPADGSRRESRKAGDRSSEIQLLDENGVEIRPVDGAWPGTWPFHAGQSFVVALEGAAIGRGGRLHHEVERALECDRPLFAAEIHLDPLIALVGRPRFRSLARLNPVERDLSFFVDRATPYALVATEVLEAAREAGSDDSLRLSFFLLDRFEGGSVPEGSVSYAFRFRFEQDQRVLTAEEMNGAIERIASRLTARLSARIRNR